MINKKKLLIILPICLVFIVLGGIFFFIKKKPVDTVGQSEVSVPFMITGLDNPSYPIDLDTQQNITDGITEYLTDAKINTANLKGKVREKSYVLNEFDEDNSSLEFLVDIPDAKRTYKISLAISNEVDGDNSLYILCPSPDELIYGTFKCEDDTYKGDT